MTSQLIITLAILAFMIVMFVWQKFPMGVTTMTCCALLAAFGILSPSEAFGGFTNNSIILVAPMMALSSAITKTSIVPYIRNKVNSLSGKKGIVLILFGLKKLQKGMNSLGGKAEKWRGILMDALFLGMISAFLGLLFANVRDGVPGFIPIVVALVSALLMGVCGILIRVLKWTWLEQYALPLCMLGAMALSIPITALMA